jgi:signal transduction histidine kinase
VPEDLVVPADPGAVRQMLLNLLDNAVKYGPAGQEVRIGATRENGVARLWVADRGPGIPRADRERVWERFWRLERDRDSSVAGSGIGLAVVRELADLHHGRAWIDDAGPDGPGTRVVIELPA